jgi:Uma2 family endonuclease
MPAAAEHFWTLEEVERLIDERHGYTPRYELVDGALLVTPSPSNRHQRIVVALTLRLAPYVKLRRAGELLLGPGAFRLGPDTYFEPDLFVVPAVGGRIARADDPVTSALLIAEVLSPGSVRHDRLTKRRAFQKGGIPEYWVVDGDAEAFEIWRPGDDRAVLADESAVWQPAGASEPFELDVVEFFASVADEPESHPPLR